MIRKSCPTKKSKPYANGGYVTAGKTPKKPPPKQPPKKQPPPGSTRDTLKNLRKRQMDEMGA
jgi:hypothetical protein